MSSGNVTGEWRKAVRRMCTQLNSEARRQRALADRTGAPRRRVAPPQTWDEFIKRAVAAGRAAARRARRARDLSQDQRATCPGAPDPSRTNA